MSLLGRKSISLCALGLSEQQLLERGMRQSLVRIDFYRALPGPTGPYPVLPGPTGPYPVLPGPTRSYRALPGAAAAVVAQAPESRKRYRTSSCTRAGCAVGAASGRIQHDTQSPMTPVCSARRLVMHPLSGFKWDHHTPRHDMISECARAGWSPCTATSSPASRRSDSADASASHVSGASFCPPVCAHAA